MCTIYFIESHDFWSTHWQLLTSLNIELGYFIYLFKYFANIMDVLGAFGVSALLREYLIIANFNIWTVREIERRINEKRAGSNKLGVVEIGLPSHHVELLEAVYNSFNAKRIFKQLYGLKTQFSTLIYLYMVQYDSMTKEDIHDELKSSLRFTN
ncbi:unnamed protein product [Rhizophagus irregularis]|nr:unnamed protein product [Rhizophagus irregularis]